MLHVANAEVGRNYRVKALETQNINLKHRLRALGCVEGCCLSIHQKGLFKGPCTLKINDQQICIRNCDACDILLEQAYE
ncbi:ferrous iron transport protein A [Staphylococcus schleiferi]|uniref:FeoA family protein n=1 Tax=Staphylococcus sp. 191 TaxID=2070016 RepID=UPI0013F3C873|nr:FeoA family protein [Staphylococcus sp. 191]NHA36368.1 ferrous iron transport protein A [Staphylococcus schleiferi]NHB70758.1 ferrous iron transport protein A [Staphylococcus sp. 191]